MADKALRLKMERGQCMDLFPVPASAVAQALAPFGLEERDALSDLLPGGTFYSPLGPSGVQSGDQGDAASYTLGKKLKKSQYVARAPGLLRMLFQPWFSQEALDRLAAGRWRCENGILAPAELGEVRLPIPIGPGRAGPPDGVGGGPGSDAGGVPAPGAGVGAGA